MKILRLCARSFLADRAIFGHPGIFGSNYQSGEICPLAMPCCVKLFDAWGGICPLQEADEAEKTAVSDDRDN